MTRRRTSKRKTSRRADKRRAPSRARTSRRVRANTIPPPPQHNHSDLVKWAKKTYDVGTRVRVKMAFQASSLQYPYERVVVPQGSVGEIVAVDTLAGLFSVSGSLLVPLFTSSTSIKWLKNLGPEHLDTFLEPIDDNWGPLVIPSKRYSPPPQRGWKKQLSASRSLRARKVQPNATCPSCGSPHYFEGMFDRDCATPTCRYFRGGTVGPTGAAEPTASTPKRTGSRRLGVSSETVHASEPDVYPEIDHESEEDIVIEADDLDEDETFAERAAKVIADELGYVEGSESRGPSRWYTQSDGDEDYGTGDVTRRSIHVDDHEWTDEEQKEIYDALKRWKRVS